MIQPGQQRAPLCVEAVTMYADSSEIRKDFVKVALLTPRHSPDVLPSSAQLEGALRKKAARLGATGVIVPPGGYEAPALYEGVAVFVPQDSAQAADLCRQVKN
jgi:hypothetical protein